MQKIKIKTTHVKTPEAELRLEYYLLLKGGMCGIEVRNTCDGESAARFVPDTPEAVYRFLLKLARGRLFPVHLNDVADDYIYENGQTRAAFSFCVQTRMRVLTVGSGRDRSSAICEPVYPQTKDKRKIS